MAKNNEEMKSDKNVAAADAWLGSDVARGDLPRYAIGDPSLAPEPGKQGTPTLLSIEATYEATVAQTIEGKTRLLHRVRARKPLNGEGDGRIYLWGNAQVDQVLPTLPPGTPFRATYLGRRGLSKGRSMKQITVEFPASTIQVPNKFSAHGGDVPF